MWVYHLGSEDESQTYTADLQIQKGQIKASFSGPVFSLLLPQTKVIFAFVNNQGNQLSCKKYQKFYRFALIDIFC